MIAGSKIVRSSLVCVVAVVAHACSRGDSDPAGDATARRLDTPSAAASPTCGVDAITVLTGDGIGALRVGASVDDVARACRIIRDTTALGAEGMTERQIVVRLGRDSASAVVDSARVRRVHVRTAAFRTADSLGVGTPGRALRRPGAQVLTGEGAHFITLPSHCGLSFRLRGVEFGRVSSPGQIPDTAGVDEVLAVGCSRSTRR